MRLARLKLVIAGLDPQSRSIWQCGARLNEMPGTSLATTTQRQAPRCYSQAMRGMPAGDSPQYLIPVDGPDRVIAARRTRDCLMRKRRGSADPPMTRAQYTRPELPCAEAMPI